jgi:hypothetical protein
MPPAPPPPAQVDPGESSLDFIRGMANPELQNELLAAEQTYRPEYNKLELADINTLLRGGGGQEGLLAQQEFAARQMQRYGSELNTAQRTADIEDVKRLGPLASEAFLGANPELARSLSEAEALRGGGMSVDSDIRQLMSQGIPQAQAAEIAQSRLGGGLQQAALGQLGGTAAEAQLTRAGMGQFRSSDEEALLGQAAMGQFQRGAGEMQVGQLAMGQLQRGAGEMQLGQAGMGQFQRGAGEMQLGQAGLGQLQQAGMGEMKLNQRGMDLLNRETGASPLQTRNAIQQARIASQARGRLGDASSVYGEIGARLSADLDLESRNLGLGSQLLGQSFGMGQQRLGTGAQFVGQEFGMGQQRVGTGAQLLGQEFGMGQQRVGTAAQLLGQEFGMGQQRTGRASELLSQRFGMGQQRLGTAAGLLGQEFGMGQQRLGTASSIYGQDLSRDQTNAAMQQQAALANQQATMTGRGMDLQGLLGLGQLQQSQQQGNRAYAMNLVGARQATASDPFAAILGRSSQAPGQGMAATQFTAGLAGQQLGPNLFDPNAGINLALQNQANQSNYQSNIYGSQAGFAGAQAQARGAMIGAALGGFGALAGGAGGISKIFSCWVAREVYGNDNPMWILFRRWLMEDSPDMFRNLYIKYGERFARFISNKPRVKRIIRNWMTSKVKQKFFASSN